MQVLPSFSFGLLNGWLPLVAYFLGLIITVMTFPKTKRKKLFYEPQYPVGKPRWFILTTGRLAAISFVGLMIFTPLQLGTVFFYAGLVLFLCGFSIVIISLLDYKRAPTDQMVIAGLYRYSRNPQWVGLVFIFLGTTVAVAIWLHFLLLAILVFSYHYQILLEEESCTQLYGDDYLNLMGEIPRYFLFK